MAIIGANTYCTTFRIKKSQIFALSIKDLEYQVEKEARSATDWRTVVAAEYHDFLDIFPKKNLDTLPSYQKYDHKIILKKKQKHGYAPLYKMLF